VGLVFVVGVVWGVGKVYYGGVSWFYSVDRVNVAKSSGFER
jgi:hypothetical protein